ncbi:MAG TPA: hypothetical protein VF281_02150 [Candidatus Saccharimonadales bacterium]
MPIKIIPRRSVTIEAWDATQDDLLRVQMSDRKVYFIRASASSYGQEPRFWFDLEFMPDDLKRMALEVTKHEIEWNSRDHHGYSVGEITHQPSEKEVLETLGSNHRDYYLHNLDYDLGLTVILRYALSEIRQWHDPNRVIHIEWVVRDWARAEVSATANP